MDRFLYVSMTGAKETLRAQTVNNHNLANASTTGFRADLSAFQSRAVAGSGFPSRAYATNATIGWDASQGALTDTGRDLDVGINGPGWIAVQGADGREAYTRAGDLHIEPTGMLKNGAGLQVMGEGGPISVPPHTSLMIAADGTISIVPVGQGPETTSQVGRIKLVNPPAESLVRGDDGLFRTTDGTDAPADANVRVASGVLETSNVNVADAMVNMITAQRNFQANAQMISTADAITQTIINIR
jgi:flagellar basal-body rod protein FlgF